MYGVESTTSAAEIVCANLGQHGSSPASKSTTQTSPEPRKRGALGLAQEAVSQALSNTGFVDVTGLQQMNFETYLHRGPTVMDMEDLKPGLCSAIVFWVASELTENPRRAMETQAHIQPKGAIRLLT